MTTSSMKPVVQPKKTPMEQLKELTNLRACVISELTRLKNVVDILERDVRSTAPKDADQASLTYNAVWTMHGGIDVSL